MKTSGRPVARATVPHILEEAPPTLDRIIEECRRDAARLGEAVAAIEAHVSLKVRNLQCELRILRSPCFLEFGSQCLDLQTESKGVRARRHAESIAQRPILLSL
jgi:hypothetical protein